MKSVSKRSRIHQRPTDTLSARFSNSTTAIPFLQKAIRQEKFIISKLSQIPSESLEKWKGLDFWAPIVITTPKFLDDVRREHRRPFDGYQNKLDRPKVTKNASLYWSDVYLQLVSEDLDESSEKATLSPHFIVQDFEVPYHYTETINQPRDFDAWTLLGSSKPKNVLGK